MREPEPAVVGVIVVARRSRVHWIETRKPDPVRGEERVQVWLWRRFAVIECRKRLTANLNGYGTVKSGEPNLGRSQQSPCEEEG
jgi:hypothetical protein